MVIAFSAGCNGVYPMHQLASYRSIYVLGQEGAGIPCPIAPSPSVKLTILIALTKDSTRMRLQFSVFIPHSDNLLCCGAVPTPERSHPLLYSSWHRRRMLAKVQRTQDVGLSGGAYGSISQPPSHRPIPRITGAQGCQSPLFSLLVAYLT